MDEVSGDWIVKPTRPVLRALEHQLPEAVAWAAYAFISERLPLNPYRLGHQLDPPYDNLWSARLGTYRVVYEIVPEHHTVFVRSIRPRSDVYGVR